MITRATRQGRLVLVLLCVGACSEAVSPRDARPADAAAGDRDQGQHDQRALDGGGGPQPDGNAAACGTITTFASGRQPTAEVHVAPAGAGSDSSGDGSAARPYATLARAVQDARPGTAVRIHAGTYPGGVHLQGISGTAEAPVWIGGAPGAARPVFEGGGTGIQLSRVRYLVLHDLEVRQSSNNGINCDDGGDRGNPDASHHLLLTGLDVHDIGGSGNQDCLKLSGIDDYWVLDSSFARCGGGDSGSGIDHVGCHDGLIANNRFEQMSGNAIQCKGGSRGIEIRNNRIVRGGQRGVNLGGSTGADYFRPPLATGIDYEAREIAVIANLIEGGVAAVAFVGCVDCLVANNTIVDPTRWVVRILQETTSAGGTTFAPSANGRFVNNLVYYSSAAIATTVNVGPGTAPDSFAFSHNLWYAHDAPGSSAPDLPVAETGGIAGQDPQLRAPPADCAIGSASPAAGRGETIAALSSDLVGRCYRSPPSIGAHEVP